MKISNLFEIQNIAFNHSIRLPILNSTPAIKNGKGRADNDNIAEIISI